MQTKKRKIYLDSSIFGWALNKTNLIWYKEANLLLKQIKEEKFVAAYSWITQKEIAAAPVQIAKKIWRKIKEAHLILVPSKLKQKAQRLATYYCRNKIIPFEHFDDAMHVAIATIWNADALVSYNFEHIVSLEIMVEVNNVNKKAGFKRIFLCEPREVIIHEK